MSDSIPTPFNFSPIWGYNLSNYTLNRKGKRGKKEVCWTLTHSNHRWHSWHINIAGTLNVSILMENEDGIYSDLIYLGCKEKFFQYTRDTGVAGFFAYQKARHSEVKTATVLHLTKHLRHIRPLYTIDQTQTAGRTAAFSLSLPNFPIYLCKRHAKLTLLWFIVSKKSLHCL